MQNIVDLPDLRQKNPWWEEVELIMADDKLRELEERKFQYQHPLIKSFPKKISGVMTLRGPRQIGKTTLVKQIIKQLLVQEKVNPKSIFYYSLNTISDFKELHEIINSYFQEFGGEGDFFYVFLDEISFVREWQRTIKDFAEGVWGKKTLFFLTGSSTIDLKFSSERLPGRRGRIKEKDVVFLPLLFSDFISLVSPQTKALNFNLPRLKSLFHDYLLTGGFPTVINEYYKNKFISSDIADIYISWIIGDLHKLGKNEKTADLIFKKLLLSMTTPLSYFEIAKQANLASFVTAFEYLDILNQIFVIFNVDHFEIAQKKTLPKKNRKYYFYDNFILLSLLAKVENMKDEQFSFSEKKLTDTIFLPRIVENMVAIQLKRRFGTTYFGRNGKNQEIDFVVPNNRNFEFYEVKYQNHVAPTDFAWFTNAFPKEKLTIITKNSLWKKGNLHAIPLEFFLAKTN